MGSKTYNSKIHGFRGTRGPRSNEAAVPYPETEIQLAQPLDKLTGITKITKITKNQQPLRLNDPRAQPLELNLTLPYPETEIQQPLRLKDPLDKLYLCLGIAKIQQPLRLFELNLTLPYHTLDKL